MLLVSVYYLFSRTGGKRYSNAGRGGSRGDKGVNFERRNLRGGSRGTFRESTSRRFKT